MALKRHKTGLLLSNLSLRDWQLARDGLVGKSGTIVTAIAKRLIRGEPAAAQGNHGAARQSESGPGWIENLEISFDSQRAVILWGNLGGWHLSDGSTGRPSSAFTPPAGRSRCWVQRDTMRQFHPI